MTPIRGQVLDGKYRHRTYIYVINYKVHDFLILSFLLCVITILVLHVYFFLLSFSFFLLFVDSAQMYTHVRYRHVIFLSTLKH